MSGLVRLAFGFSCVLASLGGCAPNDEVGAGRQDVLVPPSDDAFVPFLCSDPGGGDPILAWDPVDDADGGNLHRDVVGDQTAPAMLRASDPVGADSLLYFRIRLEGDPR